MRSKPLTRSLWGDEQGFVYLVSLIHKPNKKFMSMFMGLVDGDGYIEIGPQKQYNKLTKLPAKSTIRARLVIRLHSRDADLLNYLTKVLGVGSISSLSSNNQTRLIFSKKDLVTVIIPLINLYNLTFLTGNRARQYALLSHILKNNIVHWENVEFSSSISSSTSTSSTYSISNFSSDYLVNLDFFADWLVGFTINLVIRKYIEMQTRSRPNVLEAADYTLI